MTNEILLHGKLFVEVRCARNIPNFDGVGAFLPFDCFKTDAFVRILLGSDEIIRTHSVTDTNNPKWNKSFFIDVCHFASKLKVFVWDEDPFRNELVGRIHFPICDLVTEKEYDDWYDIIGEDGVSINGQINLGIQFHSLKIQRTPSYEVESYFPVQSNCFVTLYQDAHVLKSMPQFSKAKVQPKSCWKDLYTAIMDAQKLICIAGWAFHVDMKLLRGEDENIDSRSIGEVLVENNTVVGGLGVFNYKVTNV